MAGYAPQFQGVHDGEDPTTIQGAASRRVEVTDKR
jgi:hypothetical protein